MSQNGKLMPNLDQHHQSTKVLNLTVLQRLDPFVEEILTTAAHVTVYEMKSDLSQWRRKDVEGSLFVVKRNTQPRFQFIVMNRLSTDNLVEDLLGDFEYEVQVPYLLYRNAAQVVNGIWFYNQHESEAVANLFSRILNAYSKVPPKSKVSTTKSSEFEELEAVPSLSVIEGPLEPASSSAAPLPDVPDEAFVNFFSAAMNGGTELNAPNAGQLQSSTIPLTSNTTGFISSPLQTLLTTPSMPIPTPISLLESHELISSTSNHANLVKPSLFSPPSSAGLMMPPVSSLKATAHPLHPPLTMQQPYGTPLLQPFPPPAPSLSLTPAPNYGPVITRDKVRDALLRLVQNNNFIDMVYREMLNAHYS